MALTRARREQHWVPGGMFSTAVVSRRNGPGLGGPSLSSHTHVQLWLRQFTPPCDISPFWNTCRPTSAAHPLMLPAAHPPPAILPAAHPPPTMLPAAHPPPAMLPAAHPILMGQTKKTANNTTTTESPQTAAMAVRITLMLPSFAVLPHRTFRELGFLARLQNGRRPNGHTNASLKTILHKASDNHRKQNEE